MQAAGYSRLTDQERFYIKIRRADGVSIRDVARELGHAASTVSRELRRNALPDGGYCPVNAGRQARHRRWLGGLGRRSDERAHAFRLACSDAAERERHMTASAQSDAGRHSGLTADGVVLEAEAPVESGVDALHGAASGVALLCGITYLPDIFPDPRLRNR